MQEINVQNEMGVDFPDKVRHREARLRRTLVARGLSGTEVSVAINEWREILSALVGKPYKDIVSGHHAASKRRKFVNPRRRTLRFFKK